MHTCVHMLTLKIFNAFSLLNILAGRNAKEVTGVVTFSGDRIPHNFSRLSGFVTSVSDRL